MPKQNLNQFTGPLVVENESQEGRTGGGLVSVASSNASASPSRPATRATRPTTPASKTASITDEELIGRLRHGDRAAFDAIYQRYFNRIYHFLDKRLRNSADTEEVVQEVFINVFSSIDSFRGESPFAAWIFGLTRRTLANRFKRKRHPMVPLSDSDTEILPTGTGGVGSEPSPLEQYEYRERLTQMTDAIENRLSPEQRQMFEMHHLEAVPIGQIAERLSKSEDAVKSNLYRARKIVLSR